MWCLMNKEMIIILVFKGSGHTLSCRPPNRIEGAKTIAVILASDAKSPVLITANFVSHLSVVEDNSLNLLTVAGQSPVYMDMKPGLDTYQLVLLNPDLTPYQGDNMVIVCHVI